MFPSDVLRQIGGGSGEAWGLMMPRSATRSLVTGCAVLALTLTMTACTRRPQNPVDVIKAMVPKLSAALAGNDRRALQEMATKRFGTEQFVRDVIGGRDRVNLKLSIEHITQMPGEAELILSVEFGDTTTAQEQMVTVYLVGYGAWKLDRYKLGTDTTWTP